MIYADSCPLYGVDLENVEDILKVFALEQGRVLHASQYVLHRAVFQVLKQTTQAQLTAATVAVHGLYEHTMN